MTGYGSVQNAVEAMRKGAYDYLLKPFSLEVLEGGIENALRRRPPDQTADPGGQAPGSSIPIITQERGVKEILHLCGKVAQSKATVLIQGESGTGKELLARYIHEQSQRNQGPFVAVNCASLPETLLESELFGHEKGAFTGAITSRKGRFEMAHQGTLFLDEVEDIPPATQIKLLRVLQEGEFERVGGNKTIKVNIRIIATSNRDLQEAVRNGTFREDLYYRLNVVNIKLPALRDRREDIPFLVNFFIEKFNQKYHMKVKGISQRAMNLLMDYQWGGNVRELENMIESILVINSPEVVDFQHLPQEIREFKERPEVIPIKIGTPLEEVEREILVQTLKATKGNKRRAAELLGINVRTIHRKMEGIHEPSSP
jgi:DNA-binding NtrC family response regulator